VCLAAQHSGCYDDDGGTRMTRTNAVDV